jgi:hypothetical protein
MTPQMIAPKPVSLRPQPVTLRAVAGSIGG